MKDTVAEARRVTSANLTYSQLVVVDLLTMICTLLPVVFGWGGAIIYFQMLSEQGHLILAAFTAPAVLVVVFLAAVWLTRLAIPRIQHGSYEIGLSKGYLTWYMTLCLGHAVRISGLHPFFFAFYTPKYLYCRTMGANIAYGVNSSIFAMFADYPLITIGKGCTVGADAFILGHMFVGKKVILGPVNIGENVFVGAFSMIGLNTTVGDNTWIGMNNRFMQEDIPPNSKFVNFERMDIKKRDSTTEPAKAA
jgi:acetyltransferase-like isoleucine patch superfamily enzyme